MRTASFILVLTLLLPLSSLAATPPIVTEALSAMHDDDGTWAYVRTTVEKEGSQVDRFDPSLPAGEQWTLLKKNGKAPTAREQEAFRKERAEIERKRGANGKKPAVQSDPVKDLIREGSLKLVREDANQVVYSFLPPVDDDMSREFGDAIKGTLTIGRNKPHPFTIEMANDKPIKAMKVISIERMRMKMEFRPVAPEGPVFPFRIEALMRGRALLIKSIDEDTVTTYSEYRKVK